ncbi:MAG: prolyl oligopeptidase family serine peptidase [Gammaproteobacteria bacterium]|nr:prolyl oligopeptidase family serine peptidase [Gammaproteobacteria bacterium]
MRIDRVGAPAVSPAADLIVYAVRHTDMEADKGRYDLWLSTIEGDEPRRLTTHEANDTSPAWSPDGQHILFLSSRGDSTQVWRLPVNGGEAQPVTDLPLDVGTFRMSPTGDRLVVSLSVYLDCQDLACTADRNSAKDDDKVTAQRYDQLFMRHWDHWLDERHSQLFAIPLNEDGVADGTPVRLTRLDADVPSRVWGGNEEYAISPDGKTLYFTARLRNRDEPSSTNFDIYAAPMNGKGKPENLTSANEAWDTAPVVSPDGRYLAWLAMSRPGFEADQFQVVLRDLRSGKSRVLTENWDRSPSSVAFTRDGKSILMNAQDVGHKTLWQLELSGGEPVKLDAGDAIVFSMNNLASPNELYVFDPDTGDSRKITDFGSRTLADVSMGEFEQFSFEGAGGDTVYGFVVKPSGFKRGQKYPVAFLIHGGPQGSFSNSFHFRWNPQTYAGQGFAAVMIDFHGSTGYGQAFTDSISGDWGGKPLEDLKLGLAAAVERYEFLDGERVCALGASYGGYMINWIAGQWPDRFRCLINHDGVFDNRSMYFTTEELWFPEWEHGGPYYDNPEGYEKHNPALFVDRWQTPMLVIHGELDYRVPVTQGIAAFTALQRRGIESRFLYFPDENHWVLKPHNSVHWHEQVNAWLHQFLGE